MSRKKPAWARHQRPEMRYPEGREVMGVVAGSIAFAAPIQLKNGEIVGYRYDFPDPGPRATYDPRTHIVVSRDSLAALLDYWFGDCPNDKFASACQGANKLRAALEVK